LNFILFSHFSEIPDLTCSFVFTGICYCVVYSHFFFFVFGMKLQIEMFMKLCSCDIQVNVVFILNKVIDRVVRSFAKHIE
jgi:hypothetical protein